MVSQWLNAQDTASQWIERLPNGNVHMDIRSLDLDWPNVQLRAILTENPKKRFLIDFATFDSKGIDKPAFPTLTPCHENSGNRCVEINFGPSTRGWYNLVLTTPNKPKVQFSEQLLIGYNITPRITHFHSDDTEGPYNHFQMSINDPDGFEDISKVFLVLSNSPDRAEGSIVGIDLDKHTFFEGWYSNSVFEVKQNNFVLLDTKLTSYESFSSIVRFKPKLNFYEASGEDYHVFAGYEERFTGIFTQLKSEFRVSEHERPSIEAVYLYLEPTARMIETTTRIDLTDVKQNLSSVRIKLIGDSNKSCQLLYDVGAGRGKIISNDNYSASENFGSRIEFFEESIDHDLLKLVIKAPYPDGSEKVRAQVQAVTKKGRKSEAFWSGPLTKENVRFSDYHPTIETANKYLSRAKVLYPKRRMFKNSDIVLMRAYAPLTKPEFMSPKDFFERFSHELYTPYPYKHYPIDYDIWNYSRSIQEQSTWVPNVSFTIDTNTLNLSAFPIEPAYDLDAIAALDFNLEPNVIPPWMRGFHTFKHLLSATREPYLNRLYTGLDYGLSLGAHSIQLDGFPNGGMIVTMGGDFSEESMTKFAIWLEDNLDKKERIKLELPEDFSGFNYRNWLKEVKGIKTKNEYMQEIESLPTTNLFRDFNWSIAIEIYHKIREFLDLRKPKRYIPITSNGAPDWFAPAAFAYNSSVADALVAEVHFYPRTELKSVNSIYAYKMADALQVQLASVPKGEENDFFSEHDDYAQGILPSYIAESYAMGHRIMVPWAYWRKASYERFYTNPDNLKSYFEFIENNRMLFDGYAPITTTALVLRYTTMQPKTERIITELLANDVPFTIFLADDNFYPRHLTDEMLESVQRILLVDPINWFNEKDQLTLMKHQHKIEYSKPLSPASTTEKLIYTIPWGKPHENEHVIHLLNRNFNSHTKSNSPQQNFDVVINTNYINPTNLRAFYLEPNEESIELDLIETEADFSVRIPELKTWGLLFLGEKLLEEKLFGSAEASKAQLAELEDASTNVARKIEILKGFEQDIFPPALDVIIAALDDIDLRLTALRTLNAYDNKRIGEKILSGYSDYTREQMSVAVQTLRKNY